MMYLSVRHLISATSVLLISFVLIACGNSGDDGIGGLPLTPDPLAPARTQPPGADDEPVLENQQFNSAVGFQVYREPHLRLAETIDDDDTADQAAFDAGLPASQVSVPTTVDPLTNRAPFFSNLQNLDVKAGEAVNIRFDPEDDDGDLPGMFPQKLPLGGEFVDNFDGSKTFRWLPLQEDVGIYRFTVVAIDSADQEYRTAQSVLIRITLPDDTSTIPNVAPMLEAQRAFTVRVRDAVVIELKGQDLNGTIPTIEVPTLPAGASFNQHPRYEEIYVLKVTPEVVGTFSIDVLLRDSVDTNLTTKETVSVTVLDTLVFDRIEAPLKDLAAQYDIQVGFAALQSFYHQPDGVIYAHTAAREFNIVTPENSMKMDTINPLPGHYEFAATDNLVRFAKLHGMRIHAHPLVWYRQLPEWIQQSMPAEREQHMNEYITRIMTRFAADIDLWDVVNEPMADDGTLRDSLWSEVMGESYIDKALITARNVSPTGTLLINEFDISAAGPKFDGLMQLVERLQARGVPLDGIGFQMHLFDSFSSFNELRSNFARVAALGLQIYITELDVSLTSEVSESALQKQAAVYREVARICVENPQCKALQMWGFTDQYSFRSDFDPLPFDRSYQAKLAMDALSEAFSSTLR